jgi:Cft2 family RNA processing exonuclease
VREREREREEFGLAIIIVLMTDEMRHSFRSKRKRRQDIYLRRAMTTCLSKNNVVIQQNRVRKTRKVLLILETKISREVRMIEKHFRQSLNETKNMRE